MTKTSTDAPAGPATGVRREPYEAPRVEEVKIASGEALLSFCKTAGAPGAIGACGNPQCSAAGS